MLRTTCGGGNASLWGRVFYLEISPFEHHKPAMKSSLRLVKSMDYIFFERDISVKSRFKVDTLIVDLFPCSELIKGSFPPPGVGAAEMVYAAVFIFASRKAFGV